MHSQTQPSLPPDPDPSAAQSLRGRVARRTGKVARLPKTIRDKINSLLDDGLPYAAVLATLGEDGKSLTKHNLSRWSRGGYRDHLLEQVRATTIRSRVEAAMSLLQKGDPGQLSEAGQLAAAAQFFDLFSSLSPDRLGGSIRNDPMNYIRLVNSLCRLSREMFQLGRLRDSRPRNAEKKP